MKLLLDMNLSPRWVTTLKDAGFEALHWSTCGSGGSADTEIMAFAKANDYVVLTYDRDFSAILAATGGDKPSVVQIRADDLSPDAIGRGVILALQQMTAELDAGALLTVEQGAPA
jgi:predicted nuclease of predicted toxin-antitoxin system